MASAEIALVCGLKIWVGCQDRLCVNSDADEALALWESIYVREVLPHSCEKKLKPIKKKEMWHIILEKNFFSHL